MIKGDNRMNMPFLNSMGKALDEVERNDDVRGVIFTGEGKFFSYGVDLPWVAQQTLDMTDKFICESDALTERVASFPMPTIAAMNGHAFGMGAILALACDYRVMGKGRGWFCFPELTVPVSFSPTTLEMIRLKLHRVQVVRDAAIFSKRYTAEEALGADIVDEAVDENQVMEAAIRYGNKLGEKLDRRCVHTTKDQLYGAPLRSIRDAHLQRETEKDKNDRLEDFKRGAQLHASNM
eukprot:XP_003730750.2 PREDICTED: delta(3,5)-Delta(2,4)-dienoyl-CoA isomerase, mitochondrial-like [Strongylocentrotus purpuratus]